MRILFLDIESSPNLSYTWGKYEQNVIAFEREWNILSFAYKWSGDKTVRVFSLPDFPLYKKEPFNDKQLIIKLFDLLNNADVVVGHNIDRFDLRKINARFLKHKMQPPSPYKTVDTLKLSRKYFALNSNKLNDISEYMGLGSKEDTGGFTLWLSCMSGIKSAWRTMVKYNKQDVVLLEKVYLYLRAWHTGNPNQNLYQGSTHKCPACGGDTQKRGLMYTRVGKYQRHQCKSCGSWSKGEKIKSDKVIA